MSHSDSVVYIYVRPWLLCNLFIYHYPLPVAGTVESKYTAITASRPSLHLPLNPHANSWKWVNVLRCSTFFWNIECKSVGRMHIIGGRWECVDKHSKWKEPQIQEQLYAFIRTYYVCCQLIANAVPAESRGNRFSDIQGWDWGMSRAREPWPVTLGCPKGIFNVKKEYAQIHDNLVMNAWKSDGSNSPPVQLLPTERDTDGHRKFKTWLWVYAMYS